jgi:hypothetical protein
MIKGPRQRQRSQPVEIDLRIDCRRLEMALPQQAGDLLQVGSARVQPRGLEARRESEGNETGHNCFHRLDKIGEHCLCLMK